MQKLNKLGELSLTNVYNHWKFDIFKFKCLKFLKSTWSFYWNLQKLENKFSVEQDFPFRLLVGCIGYKEI